MTANGTTGRGPGCYCVPNGVIEAAYTIPHASHSTLASIVAAQPRVKSDITAPQSHSNRIFIAYPSLDR